MQFGCHSSLIPALKLHLISHRNDAKASYYLAKSASTLEASDNSTLSKAWHVTCLLFLMPGGCVILFTNGGFGFAGCAESGWGDSTPYGPPIHSLLIRAKSPEPSMLCFPASEPYQISPKSASLQVKFQSACLMSLLQFELGMH